ncbi:sensor histidine kinase [Actinomycetospora termitidis]|uniref:histidine kinase n=1 Tax=Actinomycetospora termitidis TaxID=3053470 RepID=A0ABT7MHR5_9PSEU|nr:histidine kinase [Actinomycetospora sp. Odt1-22]MDL5159986.1 histidine kinase [Actinomycetospora sp. Odt1-22]
MTPADVVVALAFGVWGVGLTLLFPSPPHPLVPLTTGGELAVTVVLTVVLLFRRTRPVVVALLTAALVLVLPGTWFLYGAIYAAGAHLRDRVHLWWLVPLLFAASFVGGQGWIGFRVNDHAFLLFASVLVALAGLYVGTRRELIAAAHERADRAEETARAEERARLAAEMHDVVTHRVNLMVLQAGALQATTTDPAVGQAAEELRTSGRAALAELRDLVGVLRTGEPAAGSPTAPAAADRNAVAGLVAESRAVGVDVTCSEHGDPTTLTPTVQRTLARVVQESLSNARKHARGAHVTVEVHYDRGARLAVIDSGGTPDPDLAATGGGAGLDGLRRRVAMVGGTLEAGPEAAGFAVRARLPAYVPTTT